MLGGGGLVVWVVVLLVRWLAVGLVWWARTRLVLSGVVGLVPWLGAGVDVGLVPSSGVVMSVLRFGLGGDHRGSREPVGSSTPGWHFPAHSTASRVCVRWT
jgi:hypothetical protein